MICLQKTSYFSSLLQKNANWNGGPEPNWSIATFLAIVTPSREGQTRSKNLNQWCESGPITSIPVAAIRAVKQRTGVKICRYLD